MAADSSTGPPSVRTEFVLRIFDMIRVLTIFIVAAAGTVRLATAAPPCTQEALTVEGAPVAVGYCVSGVVRSNGSDELVVPVAASYSGPRGALRLSLQLHFIAGERVSRVIQSLDLTKLGLTGMLHLTLAYSSGQVRLEGALLTPGAITIK
ncbi:MAG: hypothetical protein WAL67_10210 [Candidatus Cybelea sp.]